MLLMKQTYNLTLLTHEFGKNQMKIIDAFAYAYQINNV